MDLENNQNSLLTFRVGPVLCCAPSLPVTSIITPPNLTHPPGSDRGQPGIFRHGSSIVKVIDLREKFGINKHDQTNPGNLVICSIAEDAFAFWVDSILDVFAFPTTGWGSLPAAIPRGIFTRTLLLEKKIYLYTEFEKLLNNDVLDYLKQYIQTLTPAAQTEVKNTAVTKIINPLNKGAESKNTNHEKFVLKNESSSSTTINSTVTHSIPETKKQQTKNLDTARSPVSEPSQVKPDQSNSSHSFIDKSKTTLAETAVTSRLENRKISATSSPTPTTNDLKTNTFSENRIKNDNTNHPAKDQSSNPSTKPPSTIKNNESSSFAVLILFLLLFLTAIGFIVYLFMTPSSKISTTSQHEIKPETTLTSENNHIDQNGTSSGKIAENKITETQPDAPILENRTEIPAESVTIQSDVNSKENSVPQIQTEIPLYRADILEQDNEITITIHSRVKVDKDTNIETLSTQAFSQQIPETSAEPSATADNMLEKSETTITTEANKLETPAETDTHPIHQKQLENIKPKAAAKIVAKKQVIREVIHTVRKGDTLWAIAKKYVNDPFLYPELARLSNIKNPHRIYPGNRVRIRFIKIQ